VTTCGIMPEANFAILHIAGICCEMNIGTLRISIADMIFLNVRAMGTKSRELPEFLYQELSMNAMTLMATIPCGQCAVSIPGWTDLRGGYPILKSPPLATDGFVIVYVLKPNGRFEAEKVLYQSESYGIEIFAGIARRWVEQHVGILHIRADRYAYFVPAIEEWNVLLRDSGYAAWDPSKMPSQYVPGAHFIGQSQQDSGIIGRIPIYGGDRQSSDESLLVFAQVEVAPNPDPHAGSRWLSFAEYQQMRELQSFPPDSIVADFQDWIGSLREKSGLASWIFHPGMLFGDPIEWWGDGCRRRTQHEGIDFAEGLVPGCGVCPIPERTPVGSIIDGEAVALLDDFLGKTIVVRHSAIQNSNGDVFYTLFSHIQPITQRLGFVAKGQILGSVGKSTKARAPAHLHLAGAWIPVNISPDAIRMEHIHPGFAPIVLINFNSLIRTTS
jgi:murein DD-endopeptidase MepM/ murein hydrolase activator NlpD